MRDNLYITLLCSGRKDPTTTFCELQMLLVEMLTFFKARPIMLLYDMSLVHADIFCIYESAISLRLVAWIFVTSSPESSGQFIDSCCRISNTCVRDFTVSMALSEVYKRTSVFGSMLSPYSLAIFRGAMILMKLELCYLLQENV
jgi:hypothetical protein